MTHLTEAIIYFSDLVENILSDTISHSEFEDLTPQQLRCMQVIVKLKNPSLTDLANELNITKPTVTVLVDKLVNKEYVKRIQSNKDRRTTYLHVELKGRKIERLRKIAHDRMADRISAVLNETETAIFMELLKKLVVFSQR